jgi:serine/threonine protein kinase
MKIETQLAEKNMCPKLQFSPGKVEVTLNSNSTQPQKLTVNIFARENPKYDWQINDVMIGNGAYGRVYKALDARSKRTYALKIIEFKDYECEAFQRTVGEVFILR